MKRTDVWKRLSDGQYLAHEIGDAYMKYRWIVYTQYGAGLTYAEIDYIRLYNPTFYWDDCDCYYWAFDDKMPSGRWLENMQIDWKSNTITAFVGC